jgi:signal transduction histidine kinase
MTILRQRLHGLVFKLALFYVLLALPVLFLVEAVILFAEFHEFMNGIASGSLDRAVERGAADLSVQWPRLQPQNPLDTTELTMWLDTWVLRLRQPNGDLTPARSYILLLELADTALGASVLTPEGRELARSSGNPRWTPQWPSGGEIALAAHVPAGTAVALPSREGAYTIRRAIATLRDDTGTPALLFVELRIPSPWRRLLSDSSFESPTMLGFLIVFGIASSIFVATWVTRRLNRIARAATAWSAGDFSGHIGDRSRDELGSLSALLDRMAVDLKSLLRTRAQLATLAERQRLARDLHDTVKQKAFALNLQLATARRVLAAAPGVERLQTAQRLTQQIQQELAQIIDEMRASDAELPFAERLRLRAVEWSHTSGMALRFDLDDAPPLAAPTEESLLRIVDEALSNILRHSGATRVDIVFRCAAQRICLSIADNGHGTSGAPASVPASGMGLDNMRARALALPGGEFEFAMQPGRGACVAISFLSGAP